MILGGLDEVLMVVYGGESENDVVAVVGVDDEQRSYWGVVVRCCGSWCWRR